jgi:hypothetical protein
MSVPTDEHGHEEWECGDDCLALICVFVTYNILCILPYVPATCQLLVFSGGFLYVVGANVGPFANLDIFSGSQKQ